MSEHLISRLLPHTGTMLLLDSIVHMGARLVVCTTLAHQARGNPLRVDGRLHALAGIEMAAQAMALHQAWHASPRGAVPAGRLASARDVVVEHAFLDDLQGLLVVECRLQSAAQHAFAYTFELSSHGTRVLGGRLMVIMSSMAAT